MKRAGIIGGMGPEATVDLFRKIIRNTPAASDQEHIPIVIDNYPQIPDRTAYLKGRGPSPLPFLFESVERLERAGADFLCMPCNTAHYFIDELRSKASVPFISMIEAVLDEFKSRGSTGGKIGLLATDGTLIGRVYHRVFESAGIEIYDFDAETQALTMRAIYLLKAGKLEEAVETLKGVIKRAIDAGYSFLIAGCTEVPVLLAHLGDFRQIQIVDATEVLSRRVVSFALKD